MGGGSLERERERSERRSKRGTFLSSMRLTQDRRYFTRISCYDDMLNTRLETRDSRLERLDYTRLD